MNVICLFYLTDRSFHFMKTFKKIASIVCILVIAASYIITIVSVFLKSVSWLAWLKSSIFITVVFPAILYAILMIEKYLKNRNNKND